MFQLSSDICPGWGMGEQPVMLGLQREQFEHDERFHREIVRLNIHARMNHMALHFCKYTGQFATVRASGDPELRMKTITDSFIISLCSANALNFNLSEKIAPDLESSATFRDIGPHLVGQLCPTTRLDDGWLLVAHAVHAGEMARACEKIDHLESFPFREDLQKSVLKLCQIALMAASANNIDLLSSVHRRRCEMRTRNPLISAFIKAPD
jgi:hypothetical protein